MREQDRAKPAAIRRGVSPLAPFRWLAAGFRDLRRAPGPGLAVGVVSALLAGLGFLLVARSAEMLIFPAIGGFLIVAPLLGIGCCENSRRLEQGGTPGFDALLDPLREGGPGIAALGVALLLLLYGWLRFALLIIALLLVAALGSLAALWDAPILGGGEALRLVPAEIVLALGATDILVGGAMAALAFALTAVGLPFLVDRRGGPLAAAGTSLRALAANPGAALVWAVLIAGITFVAILPGFLGLILSMPVLGHAGWHAYRAMVEPS